jgi:tryptophan synthase alpha chain
MLALPKNALSIYFTAGYPTLNSTVAIIQALANNQVAVVEIGMPYSDPLADGPVIQESSTAAIANGMNIKTLFNQLKEGNAKQIKIEKVLMGYLNPVLQYGIENFCKEANDVGIGYVILPDMPITVFKNEYEAIFKTYGISLIHLITPNTSEERIREIDALSSGFIYAVASNSTTGTKTGADNSKEVFFKYINSLKLKNKVLVGFGINSKASFSQACQYLDGGIIGTAFIQHIGQHSNNIDLGISEFVDGIKI